MPSAPMVSAVLSVSLVFSAKSALELVAFAFQVTRFFILVSPVGVILLKSLPAALSILPLVVSSNLTVTSLPLAVVVKPFSPLILNCKPPSLSNCCSAVSPEFPANLILLVATLSNCDLLTASVAALPGAKPVIFLLPKSTPSELKAIVVPLPPMLVMLLNTGFKE